MIVSTSSSPASRFLDTNLLHVLRDQNINQSRIWRGLLVSVGLSLCGLMTLKAHGVSTADQYLGFVYKLAAAGYFGEAGLVIYNRKDYPTLVYTAMRALLVLSWLASGVAFAWWRHTSTANVHDLSNWFMLVVVMGPRLFAAVCWLANRELHALDSELSHLQKILPSS
ncbi:hypothetical protein LEN26_007978 [Aphanomyces euteiches]|nr:hypothetical protein AeMF1_015604 [Aphanomyces euteiches]KAH9131030.1 hypothetical protein LEN26_007978 [Aphanomyces euteiches]KAH9195004.1 hypothetical protein AeNC1_003037 [Aphanomyces euteiches]